MLHTCSILPVRITAAPAPRHQQQVKVCRKQQQQQPQDRCACQLAYKEETFDDIPRGLKCVG